MNVSHNEAIKAILALAMVASVLLVVGAFLLLKSVVPDAMMDAFLLILGALLTRLSDAYGYYFGDNAEAARKNETINTLAAAQAAPVTTTTTTTVEKTDAADERGTSGRDGPVLDGRPGLGDGGAGLVGHEPGSDADGGGADKPRPPVG